MLINIIICCLNFNYKPLTYLSMKNIKNNYYNNLLTYDIYKNNDIINTTLLTAEHIVPKSSLKYYNNAKRDMHNIFLTDATTNIYRSNYPFSDHIEYQNLEISNFYKFYHPCNFAKGKIARSIAYMKIVYPRIYIEKVISIDLLLKWNRDFIPDILEIKRNNLIYRLQGNFNPFILEPDNIEKIFKN